jgi:1-aminocyclopropane-1-carboxylate deaminase/D-cysteine desulfhydrase-like pyridoxal-dependent ACC family enzyme
MGASSKEAKAALADRLRAEGRRPYVVGMGAHDALVLAAVAYAAAFLEMLAQLPGDTPPDWVFTTSQGSTQAGLLVAARWLGLSTRVIGINPMGPDHEAYSSPDTIHQMVLDSLHRLGLSLAIPIEDVHNDTGYVGEKYGVPSDAGLAALHRLARCEGITLDPVYSSKGFSGLLDYVDRGLVKPGERVVFIHTGGLPGLFAYSADLVEVGA